MIKLKTKKFKNAILEVQNLTVIIELVELTKMLMCKVPKVKRGPTIKNN